MTLTRLRRSVVLLLCGGGLASSTPVARADAAIQLLGSLVGVKPSAYGLEGGMAFLFKPIPDHELLVGPKATALLAHGDDRTRFDFNSGVDATLWVVNAIGPGFAAEVVAPSVISGEDSATHLRFEPNLQVRFKRFGEEGAWALRVGVPYDSHYKWGVQAGLTLQLSGVPMIGEPSETSR